LAAQHRMGQGWLNVLWGECAHLKDCFSLHITQVNFLDFLSSWPWKVLQKAHCRATKV
jgi:hypothetical protein